MSLMSVIIVSYNIERELPRTLASFAPAYQRGIRAEEYEIIVVDNGSSKPPEAGDFAHLGIDLTILQCPDPTPSPVRAINMGLNASCGSIMGVFIDGARLASPGILLRAREAISLDSRSIVATRGRYLGPDFQRNAQMTGYDKDVEDALLARTAWMEDGYRLFDISVFDESSGPTWVSPISESNGIFMSRACWWELNGFEEHFQTPGGGLANLDLWRRATELPDARPTVLLGEATFHQLHGGVATNGSIASIENFFEEYAQIRGHEYEKPSTQLHFFGWFATRPPASEMVGELEERVRRNGSVLPVQSDSGGRPNGFTRLMRVLGPTAIKRRGVEKRWSRVVRESPLFDAEWYLATYPDVGESRLDPAEHFVRHGAMQGRNPGPDFDTTWYYGRYPDVMEAGSNALVHYITAGRSEGRRPHPARRVDADKEAREVALINDSGLFDREWYLATYPDVAKLRIDPVLHFLRYGRGQVRNPSAAFDLGRYMRENADVALARDNPLVHYISHGRGENREIHPVSVEART